MSTDNVTTKNWEGVNNDKTSNSATAEDYEGAPSTVDSVKHVVKSMSPSSEFFSDHYEQQLLFERI